MNVDNGSIELITEAVLDGLPFEVMLRLARWFTPAALARLRRKERDAALVELGVDMLRGCQACSGLEIARQIRRALRRYNAAAFQHERFQPPADDPRRAALHRILSLSGGNVLSERAIRRVLAGLSWPNSRPAMASDGAYPLSRTEPRGRDEGATIEAHHRKRRR
jgi:hypothetical protein